MLKLNVALRPNLKAQSQRLKTSKVVRAFLGLAFISQIAGQCLMPYKEVNSFLQKEHVTTFFLLAK